MVPRKALDAFSVDHAHPPSDTGHIAIFMTLPRFCRVVRASLLSLLPFCLLSIAQAQGAKKTAPQAPVADPDSEHVQERAEWFLRGRVIPGKSSAELRHRAYQVKMQARAVRLAHAQTAHAHSAPLPSSGTWTPLGPVPLASDASGGFQDYHQVSGRATAVAIDPADPTGNTVYIGGAQGGAWKSTNAANGVANNVTWTPASDDQATLSIGAIVIQPGNSDPSKSVILVGTGEADNSGDSYFGLGILRSADGGNTWTLISSANGGTYPFSGLGATGMAFSTTNTNTVVAAMAATAVGQTDDALTSNTFRGLYTSTDAGQTWTYDALVSGGASSVTSATSVVYNAAAGLFFAAVRYNGFFSSPDGLTWTRLANQPGAPGLLSTTNCPQPFSTACPIYRGEITVVPGRNEMYAWFVSAGVVDEGVWQSKDGGASWTQISDSGITSCGDTDGCGVQQGAYNLELLAVPNGTTATDLYAGAINLYKCSISTGNPSCGNPAFMNLTHVYGCDPIGSLAHVHPDQHALAYTILSSGTDLMYFANDGGIYRALDGFTGLTTGSCSGTNLFDDLNQNLGSMTQFVSFSQHSTNVDMILGGTQDNGSPATATATTSSSWENVLGGDGGYNAIDPSTSNWFASNPDVPPAGLNIQECSSGMNCNNNGFRVVVSSRDVGGDDGGFYFPYILDPQSTTSLLMGTCRVWRGPRLGGSYSSLSLNFDTLGVGTCSGGEVNSVRALAAGGPQDANGSKVIYATTDGFGPNTPTTPTGGNVWVTTNATAVSGVSSTFSNVTLNGPGGRSINPNQFPISAVAIDTSDPTGQTAYVTVMGFNVSAGGAGHVWQTMNAGANWTDFSGTGSSAIPDSPANAVVVDATTHIVYVGTDVGVFQSPTSGPTWSEVGPAPDSRGGATGFLPNVAVTALALFNSGGQKLLRASTYGRGVWQFDLLAAPDFQIAVPNASLTAFAGTTPVFNGTVTAVNGYSNAVTLTCTAGSTSPPNPCTPNPSSFTPASNGTLFSLTTGSTVGDYSFNVQASDSSSTTHVAAVTLSVVNFGLTAASPTSITDPRGTTSPPVNFQVTAQGSFNQTVTLSCSFSPAISGASCAFTPGTTVNPTPASPVNATATVTVPLATATGNYTVTLQATTSGAPAPASTSFTAIVSTNPDFVLTEPSPFPNVKLGSTGTTGPITISSQDGFTGTVALSCANSFGVNSCNVSPTSVNTFPATVTLTINGNSFSGGGSFQVAVVGTSGSITNLVGVPFNVGTYLITGPSTLSAAPGGQVPANLTFSSSNFYSGQVNATCDAMALPGAQCTLTPANPITVGAASSVPVTATINVPNNATPGAYNITVNSQDVTGEPTAVWGIILTVNQDFSIGSLTPSTTQTITAGQSVSYNFNVLPVGSSFTNAINLSCSGAPTISLCTFTPNPVTPGNSSAAVVLKISTTHNSDSSAPHLPALAALYYTLWLVLPALALLGTRKRRGKRAKFSLPASLLGLFLLALLLPSCGGGGSNGGGGGGGGQQQGTLPGTYTITVTGTSGALSHQASTVTLVVNP